MAVAMATLQPRIQSSGYKVLNKLHLPVQRVCEGEGEGGVPGWLHGAQRVTAARAGAHRLRRLDL